MKRVLILVLFLLTTGLMISACGETDKNEQNTSEEAPSPSAENQESIQYPQFAEVQDNEKLAVLHTSKGEIKVKLFPKIAPKAVENFLTHSQDGYYDGVTFHRVIADFMIQAGDPDGTGMGGESIWGAPFEDEFSKNVANFRGALSMANIGKPDTNGSQFFIVQNATIKDDLIQQMEEVGFPKETIELYKEHGGAPWLDGKHTVFGHVIDGMDVVDAIASAAVNENNKPEEDVVIESIEVIEDER